MPDHILDTILTFSDPSPRGTPANDPEPSWKTKMTGGGKLAVRLDDGGQYKLDTYLTGALRPAQAKRLVEAVVAVPNWRDYVNVGGGSRPSIGANDIQRMMRAGLFQGGTAKLVEDALAGWEPERKQQGSQVRPPAGGGGEQPGGFPARPDFPGGNPITPGYGGPPTDFLGRSAQIPRPMPMPDPNTWQPYTTMAGFGGFMPWAPSTGNLDPTNGLPQTGWQPQGFMAPPNFTEPPPPVFTLPPWVSTDQSQWLTPGGGAGGTDRPREENRDPD